MLGSTNAVRWFALALRAAALVVGLAGALWIRYGKSAAQKVSGIQGRDWPTVSALIDIVTVSPQSEQTRNGQCTDGYLATLTYFYRNSDLQTGDYCRVFESEEEARMWGTPFKGRSVLVYVNPQDPAKSVLRAEEL